MNAQRATPPFKETFMATLTFEQPKHLAFVQQLEADIRFNLSDSCAQGLALDELLALQPNALSGVSLGYAPIQGALLLREQIANFHSAGLTRAFNAEQVATFCGAQEAIFAVMSSLLSADDEVIVFTPCYPSLAHLPQVLGAKVHTIALQASDKWQYDIDALAQHMNERTRLIIVNMPHNPTGTVLSAEQAERICQLASEFGCYILADEVALHGYSATEPLGSLFSEYDKTIHLGVMSKSLGLAGLRVGWAISQDRELMQQMQNAKTFTSICCSAVDEQLARVALMHSERILHANNQQIIDNIAHFKRFIAAYAGLFSWQAPQAGSLALVKFNHAMPVEALATALAKEQQTLILPSSLFDLSGNYFRLGLGKRNFAEGLMRLSALIDDHDLYHSP